MTADEVVATRAYIEQTYGGTSPMSRHSQAKHHERDRDEHNRNARVRETLAHGHRQAGDTKSAEFQERAAREESAKAVAAQRAADAAADRASGR